MPTRIILALMLSLLVLPAFAQENFDDLDIDQLRLRAEQGDADAQYTLGFMYANGRGVPQDYQEAVRLFRLAADQEDASRSNLSNPVRILSELVG